MIENWIIYRYIVYFFLIVGEFFILKYIWVIELDMCYRRFGLSSYFYLINIWNFIGSFNDSWYILEWVLIKGIDEIYGKIVVWVYC